MLSLVRFDFSQLEGDLLGELYQSYFDPETRKALGEFYTPPEVVEFILDEGGYHGEGRLLDPATGSGTFFDSRTAPLPKSQRGPRPRRNAQRLGEGIQARRFRCEPVRGDDGASQRRRATRAALRESGRGGR